VLENPEHQLWSRVHCRISTYPGVAANNAAKEIEERIEESARQAQFLATKDGNGVEKMGRRLNWKLN
jgi:hypothetical protein